jgi:NAD(P)-dependent dehydrogenase (short-subunit alcohol dehydrogenase family)
MFNNAGITVGAEIRDMGLKHFRFLLDTNLWGVIYGSMYAYSNFFCHIFKNHKK